MIASHVKTLFRGNVDILGLLDTYGDIALGRTRGVSGDDLFTLPSLIRGQQSTDIVEINQSTSGFFNIKGDTLNSRRLSGPTISRIDEQLQHLLGWKRSTIPAMATDYRDYVPYDYDAVVDDSRDDIDEGTGITTGVSIYSGKVDSWKSEYIQYNHNAGNIGIVDKTVEIVRGIPYTGYAGDPIISGFVRGQLHAEGLTARGKYSLTLPVTLDEAGIPEVGGTISTHPGDPTHQLSSSDMYLDADGEWRYLFDHVYLAVENN